MKENESKNSDSMYKTNGMKIQVYDTVTCEKCGVYCVLDKHTCKLDKHTPLLKISIKHVKTKVYRINK